MASPALAPITRQVSGRIAAARIPSGPEPGQPLAAAVAELPVLDASGRRVPFGALFQERRAIVVFVRHFLCYTCKEYVEDLAKIPKIFLQEASVTLIVIGQSSYHHIEPFCKLTGYCHEIYVDPEREIYKRLGMKRGEEITSAVSDPNIPDSKKIHFLAVMTRKAICEVLNEVQEQAARQCFQKFQQYYLWTLLFGGLISCAVTVSAPLKGQSPHIKSNILSGSFRSLWRAVTGPLFDFQGDPVQQGGTLILGPGHYIHFIHRDRNRLDHKPINSILQLVGVQHVDFTSRPSVIHV